VAALDRLALDDDAGGTHLQLEQAARGGVELTASSEQHEVGREGTWGSARTWAPERCVEKTLLGGRPSHGSRLPSQKRPQQ
jgi:hypothetical protein